MMEKTTAVENITGGKVYLGMELGSTRIKSVLIGPDHSPLAFGSHDWENQLVGGYWTYDLKDVWAGIQSCYAKLAAQVQSEYNVPLKALGGIGISGMMHGYLPFDKDGKQLAAFRTWRNTTTAEAAKKLTELYQFNVPQRWSIAHLYQAILNQEAHVKDIAFMTTLAGYVHYTLTGQKVLGVGESSGMFPIDSLACDYDAVMVRSFDKLLAGAGCAFELRSILPKVLSAGAEAGVLTEKGARLLDPSGVLQEGIPLCPPEGDAGTGMVATNSISPRTGNVSAGTSVFAMIVLEKGLSKIYEEIDLVTTPAGKPVAMVHCNNCTSDLDSWVRLFTDVISSVGLEVGKPTLYDALYHAALDGAPDGGGLLSYNYYSGEPITATTEGRPLFTRMPDSNMTLPNFMRALLYSTMATLKLGMDILTQNENVQVEQLLGHGGLFKTKGVAQRLMASTLGVPVAVMESAGEGGAWGIALLACYMRQKTGNETLENYLANNVFKAVAGEIEYPNDVDRQGFEVYMKRYSSGLAVERSAIEHLSSTM